MHKIALYGISTETKKALNKLEKYEIVGLLDGFRQDGQLFGKPIISLDKAISLGIEIVIVVARPGSCKVIAQRIRDKCITEGIQVYDMRGNNLLFNEKDLWNYDRITSFVITECEISKVGSSLVKKKLFLSKFKEVCKKEKNCVSIISAYDIGYLFCAPMIVDFVAWFSHYVSENKVDNIWFLARDGYLIKKLFDKINRKNSDYFLTSRIAAIRAGVRDIVDLESVNEMKYSGTISQNIRERFGIETKENINDISDCREDILKRAKTISKGYVKYIEKNGVNQGNIAVFDFVAKGTTQYFLQRLVPENHFVGLYFLQLEPGFMKDKELDIISFYKNVEFERNAIFDNYYILETILTSPEPSCIEFKEDGTPVFAEETRSESAKTCINLAQQGIIDYFDEFLLQTNSDDIVIDKKFDEIFLKLIHNVKIEDDEFLKLIIEDPFFNRMTSITDVL